MNSIWYPIIIVGSLTFLSRLSFIVLSERISIHPRIYRAFRYIPIAVLSAIIFPQLILNNGSQYILATPRLAAGLIAILIAWRTKNVILTITSGMLALYIVQYLINL
jgi:branched-subunit amino acid transport protein